MIHVYTAAYSAPKDRRAGCAVTLIAPSPDGTVKRTMSFRLGTATLNLAVLQAAKLGVMAVKPQQYANGIVLHVDHPYVLDMLATVQDGVGMRFSRSPQANAAQVTDLRSWISRVPKLEVIREVFNDGWGAECVEAAKKAAEKQISSDAGSRVTSG